MTHDSTAASLNQRFEGSSVHAFLENVCPTDHGGGISKVGLNRTWIEQAALRLRTSPGSMVQLALVACIKQLGFCCRWASERRNAHVDDLGSWCLVVGIATTGRLSIDCGNPFKKMPEQGYLTTIGRHRL